MSIEEASRIRLLNRAFARYSDVELLLDDAVEKVVLDTCVLLDAHCDKRVRDALIATWDPSKVVFVVSTVVFAELATKTHPESYHGNNGHAAERAAAHQIYTMVLGRHAWPQTGGNALSLLGLGITEQFLIACNRNISRPFVTWSWNTTRNRHEAVPAMADHQVLEVAAQLHSEGHRVTFCTIDRNAASVARSLGLDDPRFEVNLQSRREHTRPSRFWNAPQPWFDAVAA